MASGDGGACCLCGGQAVEVLSERDRHGGALVTVLCAGCGLVRNDPIPSQEELDSFYAGSYRESYKGASAPRLRQIARNFERTRRHMERFADVYGGDWGGGGRWLDLGCGSGEFVYLGRSLGAEVRGIEPHAGYARHCREALGLEVERGTLDSCAEAEGSLALIRLSHVLEHMRDPLGCLRRLRGWLRPGGVLYVEVPDIEDEARHKLGGRLFHYGHIHNFNPVTLRALAGLAGLEELARTRGRTAGQTGVFLTPAEVRMPDAAVLAANAVAMRAVMEAHGARLVPRPVQGTALGRLVARLGQRAGEVLVGARHRTPRALAEASAKRLRAAVEG